MKNTQKGFIGIGLIVSIIAAVVLVGGISYTVGKKSAPVMQDESNSSTISPVSQVEEKTDNTVVTQPTVESPNSEMSTYSYQNSDPTYSNYYSLAFSYATGADFLSSYDYRTKTAAIGWDNLTGTYPRNVISITDMDLPSDFCTNSKYEAERIKLFGGVLTAKVTPPICVSKPSSQFKIPGDYIVDALNKTNVNRERIQAGSASVLPMVVGKFYIKIAVAGSFAESDAGINKIKESFVFAPYWVQ